MIASGIRNIIQVIFILLMLHFVLTLSQKQLKYAPIHTMNKERSADTNYKYAWFTREIHDDSMNNDENSNSQEESIFRNKMFNRKMLNNFLNQKYQPDDKSTSESSEKI